MVDPTKQRGETGRPIGPEPEKEQEVDPEKFKKILKVEKSSEAEKRHKRRLKKGEETEEDEDVEETLSLPPSSTAFSELMEDQNRLDQLFDPESPGTRTQTTPKTPMPAPEPGSILTEGIEVEEPTTSSPPPQAPSPYQPQPPPQKQNLSYNQPPPPKTENHQANPSDPPNQNENSSTRKDQTHVKSKDQSQQKTKHHSKEKKEKDASLLISQPAKDALKSKKKLRVKPKPHVKIVKSKEEKIDEHPYAKKSEKKAEKPSTLINNDDSSTPPPTSKKTSSRSTKKEKPLDESIEGIPPPPIEQKKESTDKSEEKTGKIKTGIREKKGESLPKRKTSHLAPRNTKPLKQMTFNRLTPEQIHKKKMKKSSISESATPTNKNLANLKLTEETTGMMGDERKNKKNDFPFINAEQLTTTFPTPSQILPPVTPPTDASIYSKLSPEIFELFEKMVGTVIIQDQSGIHSTTLTLNLPHSIFNGAEVIFDQYKTAPNAYNLQLLGSPEAVDAFNANMADLVAAFKQGQYAFEVNVLRPALIQKKHLIRRKGGTGDSGSQNKK